jgi:hypothetical protein
MAAMMIRKSVKSFRGGRQLSISPRIIARTSRKIPVREMRLIWCGLL